MVVWPGYFEPNADPYIPIGGNHWRLGDPDWGTVISGYVGAILALALMYAVAILASAVSADEVSLSLIHI